MELKDLNPNQQEAVRLINGPIMILAGAGSGKTRTLVSRISYLLKDKMISPFKVLALTFSNKAAREMRDRVSQLVDMELGALQITTFHSFCVKVLRSEIVHLGLSRNFTIYDNSESKAVVKSLLGKRGISTKEISPFEILHYIEEIKNLGHYIDRAGEFDYEIDSDHEFYSFYLEYESELHKANALDFGGLIAGVIELFEKFPDVKTRYQKRFEYLLVDEYQDTNKAQFELLKMLSNEKENICVVGDEDQSIYSWRGADISNILDFEKIFPQVKVIKLEQNYRSSKNIIEAATCVIEKNSLRKGKKMWTENPQGESIKIVECKDDRLEGNFIADEILSLKEDKVPLSDVSVFYRTNSQSRLIEDNLRKKNIPYRIIGGTKFYDRKEVKDMLAYMRIVVNDKDSLAISRIINVPARGIGAISLRKLEDEAIKMSSSLWETLKDIVDNLEKYSHLRLSAKIKSALGELVNVISEVKVLEKEKTSPVFIFEKLLQETGYFNYLKANKDFESIARLENLEELGNAIKQYEQSTSSPSLLGFLENITLDSNLENVEEKSTGEVSLMTVHGAKGLEFPYVFLAGVEENLFPSYKSLDMGVEALEEERRLFYVAMTRAMNRLYITFARGRMLFGQIKFNGPSRFIDEIPEHYYNWQREGGEDSTFDFGGDDKYFSQENTYNDDLIYQVGKKAPKEMSRILGSKYHKGLSIFHSLYGEGKILETKGSGEQEKILIKFKDGAKKRFMAAMAPISLIE
ncbi:MAG: ATP-dependent DNA helicase PcrA [Epsilonproteobacteria bacterium]|nr:MAG: ATP-dependent DNA helicase PcrA [Campylobacterota bacterium]RLA67443.1 MAG: ATP-dependent DNA helicase PcrA [Campylobacterota bacterium]